MEVKPNYKETETGVIPEEWAALPARDIGTFKGGSGFPLTAQGEGMGAYPFFKVSDMNNEGNGTFMITANHYVSEATRKRLGATAFPTGTIVFAKVGAAVFLERKKVLAQPSCIDNNMAAFVLDKTRADVRYLHLLLLGKKLGTLVATTALPALNGKQLGEMILAIPPLPEQRAIAAALSDVDALLGGLDRLIAKKRDLKQAAMQQLLTGQTRLPGFSGAWEVKRLDELGKCFAGGTPSTTRPDCWGGNVFWLPSGRIQNNTLVAPSDSEITITQRGLSESAAKLIKPFSVLVAITGATCANVALLQFEAAANQSVVAIEPFEKADARFTFYALQMERGQILSRQGGSAQGGVNLKAVKGIEIQCPDHGEQTAIAAVLADMDAALAALEARRDKTRDLKHAMMQELLTGKTRLVKPEAAHA